MKILRTPSLQIWIRSLRSRDQCAILQYGLARSARVISSQYRLTPNTLLQLTTHIKILRTPSLQIWIGSLRSRDQFAIWIDTQYFSSTHNSHENFKNSQFANMDWIAPLVCNIAIRIGSPSGCKIWIGSLRSRDQFAI